MTKFTEETAPFRRRPRSWYSRATAAFCQPQGGLPAANAKPQKVDCGPFVLTYLAPSAAFGEGMGVDTPSLRQISLDTAAFRGTNLGSARAEHETIDLGVSNWIYHLPRWHTSRLFPIPHPPYAIITAYWQLERVKHGIQLRLEDMNMLEDYLRHDYISHLESENGPNWRTRKEARGEKTLGGDPLPQYRIDDILRCSLLDPPQNYEVMPSNGLYWLRYLWERRGVPNTLNFTTIVLPDVLLTASFHITEMNSEPGADWWSLFLEDCDILVRTIACQHKALPGAD